MNNDTNRHNKPNTSEQLSALLDGELSKTETHTLLESLQVNANQADTTKKLLSYQYISDHLHHQSGATTPSLSLSQQQRFSEKVIKAIQSDAPITESVQRLHQNTAATPSTPTPSTPRPAPRKKHWLPSLAAAACLFIAMISSTYWYVETPPSSLGTTNITASVERSPFNTPPASNTSPASQQIPVTYSTPVSKNRPSLEDFAKLAAEDRAKFNRYYMMHTGSATMVGPSHSVTLARVVDLDSGSLDSDNNANIRPANHSP